VPGKDTAPVEKITKAVVKINGARQNVSLPFQISDLEPGTEAKAELALSNDDGDRWIAPPF
jgi:hypothetical protein